MPVSHPLRTILPALSVASILACALAAGCQPAEAPVSTRDARAQKWLDRAKASYRTADIEDASDAVQEALRVAPGDAEVRLTAASIAIARLDFDKTLRLTEGMHSSEAHALRGRAAWYAGQVETAGAELEALLRDPEVHDPWAKSVSLLANRGAGRKPYTVTGNVVAREEMTRARGSSAFVVPIEVDGEAGLALVATGTAEVVLDSSQRREPAWVSLRVAGRVELHDVPAITQDLSGIARQLGLSSLKALLGVNFLRHGNVTVDFLAQQFVVRRFVPPRPPTATDVPLFYIRGGGMLLRSALRPDMSPPASLMVDSSMSFPIALDAEGWRKAGVDPATLRPLAADTKLREGVVPMVRVGAFDLPQVPGVAGVDLSTIEKVLGLDIDGLVGSGLLAGFRVTLGDGGRTMWLEEEGVSSAGVVAPAAGAAAPAPAPPLPAPSPAPPPARSAAPSSRPAPGLPSGFP
jgi:hypothetical protein